MSGDQNIDWAAVLAVTCKDPNSNHSIYSQELKPSKKAEKFILKNVNCKNIAICSINISVKHYHISSLAQQC